MALQQSLVLGNHTISAELFDANGRAALRALRLPDEAGRDKVTALTLRVLNDKSRAVVQSEKWSDEQFQWVMALIENVQDGSEVDPEMSKEVRAHRIIDPPIVSMTAVLKMLAGELSRDQSSQLSALLIRMATSKDPVKQGLFFESIRHTSLMLDPKWRSYVQTIVDQHPESLIGRSAKVWLRKIERVVKRDSLPPEV